MDEPVYGGDDVVSFDAEGLRFDTSEDAEVICRRMAEKARIEALILQGNTFGIEAAERVGLELANHPELRAAYFKDLFTSRGREEVPEALSHLLRGIINSGASLEFLDLSDNAIGPIGAPSVIEFLQSPSAETLEILYLNNCGLGPEGSTSIAAFIPRLVNLKRFVCGRNRLENKGAASMSRALSEFTKLEVIRLNQNGIKVEGIKKLVDGLLPSSSTLLEIDLSDNVVKAEGAETIARFIREAQVLSILRLDDDLLENEGFSIVCDALSKSQFLPIMSKASFEGNELGGEKIVDLIEITFSHCTGDFTLNLLENDFTPKELCRLEKIGENFTILVDDEVDSDDESNDGNDEYNGRERQLSEEDDDDDDEEGEKENGEPRESREIFQDFITATKAYPRDDEWANQCFWELVSTGKNLENNRNKFVTVQILCEELGLVKSEETRKKKPLAREAIICLGKRLNELPTVYRDFLQVVIKNNDELECGKLLFQPELNI